MRKITHLLPCKTFAAVEDQRAAGLEQRIEEIKADPGNPSNAVLHHYKDALADARSNAAQARNPQGGA